MIRQRLAPFLTVDKLRLIAEEFLREFHPQDTLPIPIDEIVSFEMKIEIEPFPMLRERRGVDGFVSKDCSTIYIDQDILNSRNPNRFRFTLAHELTHILLHQRVFQTATFTTVAGWIEFISTLPANDLRWIEQHAYAMAGYLLVPRKHFEREYSDAASKIEQAGSDIRELEPMALKRVAEVLAKRFHVSWDVIRWQGVRENYWKQDDFPVE